MSPEDVAGRSDRRQQRIAGARQAAVELAGMRIEQRVEPSLGVVMVDVWGELLEVRLDRAGLRLVDPGTVDKRVVHAIRAAEQRAARIIDEYVRRGSPRPDTRDGHAGGVDAT